MAPGHYASFRTIFDQSERSAMWLQFDNHYTTYMANLDQKIFPDEDEKNLWVSACQIQEDNDIIRLGERAQVMIRAILKRLQDGHDENTFFGDNITPDGIFFKDGDLSFAFIHEQNGYVTDETKQTDYRNVDNLITFLVTECEINETFLPQDLLNLRGLLQNPEGMELYILNHFSLWGYKERERFIKRLDSLKQEVAFANNIRNICNEIETDIFDSRFDLQLYVPSPSVIALRITHGEAIDKSSFDYIFRLMRNTYDHGKTYETYQGTTVRYTTQQLEYMLHSCFPFAISELCIQLTNFGYMNRFFKKR